MTEQMKITGDYFVIVTTVQDKENLKPGEMIHDQVDTAVWPARDMEHATRRAGQQALIPCDGVIRSVFIAVAIAQVQPQFAIMQLVEAVTSTPDLADEIASEMPEEPLDEDDQNDTASWEQEEMRREDEEEDRRANYDAIVDRESE